MIGKGLFILTILSNCVLSLPVTSSQLENEDVKVMKCIVEALADVLSRPHPMPVSQECLVTLKTDDRLVTILRHHNFLKELQEIAVQGSQERAQLPRGAGIPDHVTETPQTTDDAVDRSMLEALGGPGERSILSQKKRTGNGDREEEKDMSLGDGESQEEMQAKRENDEKPRSHVSESVDDWSEGTAEKREEEEDEYEEKREHSEEKSEEENMTEDKKGAGSDEKRDSPRNTSKEKKSDDEDEEEKDKRSALFSHKLEDKEEEPEEEEDEGEMKRGSRESLKPWTKRAKGMALKKKAVGKEVQELNSPREVPHHSKEVTEEDVVRKKKSPEEKELQMIARRAPEERRGSEEEGSASRKSEEPEIESLAAIESELENVAQKLHELRRG